VVGGIDRLRGEGMVAKPLQFVTKSRRGVVQPAVKCRGREYLRMIYRPEYTAPEVPTRPTVLDALNLCYEFGKIGVRWQFHNSRPNRSLKSLDLCPNTSQPNARSTPHVQSRCLHSRGLP